MGWRRCWLLPIAVMLAASPRATGIVYGASLVVTLMQGLIALLEHAR